MNIIYKIFLGAVFTSLSTFASAQSPEFTSTPVVEGELGEFYQYNITTSGWWFFAREIILTGGTLPDGIQFTDHGDGTAVMEGIPQETGSFEIQLTVRRVSNHNQQDVQDFTLTIRKKAASVILDELSTTYNGNPYVPEVSTSPPGLEVELTYNGSASAPVNAGAYTVVATINDEFYEGSTTGTLTIAKAAATINLQGLTRVYSGSPQSVHASTTPSGLPVNILYSGSPNPPSDAGSYQVNATIESINYSGSANGTLVIEKKEAAVSLSNLSANYDGSAKSVTVATSPEGLNVAVYYDGSVSPPVDIGTYSVEAVINEKNYFGSANGTLIITGEGDVDNPQGRPVISNLEGQPIFYNQADPGVPISSTLVINDIDDTEMEGATVYVDKNYISGEDLLQYDNKLNENITGTFDADKGILTLTGTDTRSNYEIALSNVLYRNNVLGETSETEKRITITVNDGTSDSGPVSRDIFISVLPELDIVNAFTPNGDNINDRWNFVNLELYSVIDISIFNKDGIKVYSCSEKDCSWDGAYKGKLLPADVYFYVIDLDNGKRKYRGTVTLLR